MIAGKECLVWYVWLFRYGMSEIFDMGWHELDDKKYGFDKVVLFVDWAYWKSIDFTGVLSDFEIVILIVYEVKFCGLSAIFGWVRENA